MCPDERSTFLTTDELLARAIADCQQVQASVADARERTGDERARLLLTSLEEGVAEIRRALEGYRETAPDEVSEAFTQYAVEPEGGPLPDPPTSLTVETVTDWTVALISVLEVKYGAMADLALPSAVQAAFEGMAQLARGQARRASREGAEARDV